MTTLVCVSSTTHTGCRHCGQALPDSGGEFCCPGCAAAFDLIQGLGLGRYYEARVLDTDARPMRPDSDEEAGALDRFIRSEKDGRFRLDLMVEGLQCGACVWLIEAALARLPGVTEGRVNMSTRRLRLVWAGPRDQGADLVRQVSKLGYRLAPFDLTCLKATDDLTGRRLTRALAVAGFAAGNIMMLSIGVWAGGGEIGAATRDLLHWISALIAVPTVAYAGQPFFSSAWTALRQGRASMDLPISVGVLLVTLMSLVETARGGEHAYFDSAAALLFFLLIGRSLDHLARKRARVAAEQLIALRAVTVTVIGLDGITRPVAADSVEPGWHMQVASGERIGVDGVVLTGSALLDQSLITGESLPKPVNPGDLVFAGTLNLGAPLTVQATATGEGTVLAECVRLIEAAEGRRGRFVGLADRIARLYAPVVHLAALMTCLLQRFLFDAPWPTALMNAAAVLIITCPCALALAVPAVQVITAGRLFRRGILLKSATALERLANVTLVAFDKTGTLSEPDLALQAIDAISPEDQAVAVALAGASRHPLARALARAVTASPLKLVDVKETPGAGVEGSSPKGRVRLGSAAFCDLPPSRETKGPTLWLTQPDRAPIRFDFIERARSDSAATIGRLQAIGLGLRIFSGDRPGAVAALAGHIGIGQWRGGCTPLDKVQEIESLEAAEHHVLMVGDGLNDGPALAAASVSMSPSTAQDISQNAADLVFQGDKLAPVADVIEAARHARRLIRQNIVFSILYNALFLPLAVMGLITPWLAAAAMSSSSLVVLINSFRKSGTASS